MPRYARRVPASPTAPPTGATRSSRDRLRAVGPELGKFVVVGGSCFLLDFLLFNAFHFGLGLGPLTSTVLSTIIATLASYVGNRLWSFAHRVSADTSETRSLGIYLLINLVGLAITLAAVGVGHYVLDLTGPVALNIAKLVGTGVATVFRFWGYRRWVFDKATAEVAALV